MLYALICTDKPNSLAIRKANRPEHVAYLKSLGDTVVLIEAASLDAARQIAAGDPFAKVGLFTSVEIRPWLWTFNKPSNA